jgi:hypothetical protein
VFSAQNCTTATHSCSELAALERLRSTNSKSTLLSPCSLHAVSRRGPGARHHRTLDGASGSPRAGSHPLGTRWCVAKKDASALDAAPAPGSSAARWGSSFSPRCRAGARCWGRPHSEDSQASPPPPPEGRPHAGSPAGKPRGSWRPLVAMSGEFARPCGGRPPRAKRG